MRGRRLLLLGLGVTALLVLAGIASNNRPLRGGGRGNGASIVFFDYVYTTIAVVSIAMLLVLLYAVLTIQGHRFAPPSRRWRIWSSLLGIAMGAGIAMLLLHSNVGARIRQSLGINAHAAHLQRTHGRPLGHGRNARIRWDEVGLVLLTLTGIVVVLAATRPARRPPRERRERSQEALSQALDESLDDLRNEPDLRRAIIAAYARMERVLAAGGLPRRPSEAPFEYIARALRELETSADAAEDLTALFEWAKFSQHEPAPEMRDQAIDALVAVRDELRAPLGAAA